MVLDGTKGLTLPVVITEGDTTGITVLLSSGGVPYGSGVPT